MTWERWMRYLFAEDALAVSCRRLVLSPCEFAEQKDLELRERVSGFSIPARYGRRGADEMHSQTSTVHLNDRERTKIYQHAGYDYSPLPSGCQMSVSVLSLPHPSFKPPPKPQTPS